MIPFIYKYKINQKKLYKKYSQKFFIPKSFFWTGRLPDPIESDPVIRKKKFQQIWKADMLINYKIAEKIVFDENYN